MGITTITMQSIDKLKLDFNPIRMIRKIANKYRRLNTKIPVSVSMCVDNYQSIIITDTVFKKD